MAHAFTLHAPHDASSAQTSAPSRPGAFRRILAAMMESRQRRAEREIERYITANGFTDSIEREIERRYLAHPEHL